MVIIETPVFTRRIQSIMSNEEYRFLQLQLIEKPEMGKIIPGSGGLRKIRWAAEGKGKRSGTRVIYYWFTSENILLMLFAFKKNEADDLTKEQLKQLKNLAEEELQ